MAKGSYSLIQFYPDRIRAEAVNVGLAVVCSETDFASFNVLEMGKRTIRYSMSLFISRPLS